VVSALAALVGFTAAMQKSIVSGCLWSTVLFKN